MTNDALAAVVRDEYYMQLALAEARQAQALGEVPIGAVLVQHQRVLARCGNRREFWQDPTAHAEQIVLREAARRLGSWRLLDCTLYVTLEPCLMCMGAIVLARVPRLVFGARDPRVGAVGSVFNFAADPHLNHAVRVTEGVCGVECSEMLSAFFQQLRSRKKAAKFTP